jgi:biotin carboxylase
MRRLLILGANIETVPIIYKAKEMGFYVFVTDNNPDAPAKKHADFSLNIDGFDIETLKRICLKEKIDAVLVGVADRLIKPYQELCFDLNLPCYVSSELAIVFSDKELFNNLCKDNNLPIIPQFKISDPITNEELLNLQFPIFAKPPDSNSGKGMSIVYNLEELAPAINKAKKFSKRNAYFLDKLMVCDDMFVYFTFLNGECYLSATADRYTSCEQTGLSKVCLGGEYPSKYTDLFIKNYFNKFKEMFKKIDVNNGVLMISAFVENDNLYFYDPGYRLQGEAPNNIIYHSTGLNQIELLIDFAAGNNLNKYKNLIRDEPKLNGKYGATVWFLLKKGKIKSITGIEQYKNDPAVVEMLQRFYVNDEITEEMLGTEAQVFIRIYVVVNSKVERKLKIDEIQTNIKVLNTNYENMLLKGFTSS